MGMKSKATAREIKSVEMIETPMFLPIIFTMKFPEKINGRKTIMVVRVPANIDLQTSLVPCLTEVPGSLP